MTIEETIEQYENNAEYERTHGNLQGCFEFIKLAKWLKELKELRLIDANIRDAINNCEMKKLAQDEVSSFEHEVLKIYGVME